ncbi:helix-turn-helix domain-containing protein [Buttiauxella brennerae]|uniref:helix-turn-helix domain-containing protein n=1 Tax=Buttiauxella brennerae TaxID=82988 RepID=UPI0007E39460|nr:helix-turn-helix domain-containing protein [Buttiauxella brennerae]
MIQYLVKYGINCIQINDAGKQEETRLKVQEHKAQGLTQKKAAEAMEVSLRTVATYWNQEGRI